MPLTSFTAIYLSSTLLSFYHHMASIYLLLSLPMLYCLICLHLIYLFYFSLLPTNLRSYALTNYTLSLLYKNKTHYFEAIECKTPFLPQALR